MRENVILTIANKTMCGKTLSDTNYHSKQNIFIRLKACLEGILKSDFQCNWN